MNSNNVTTVFDVNKHSDLNKECWTALLEDICKAFAEDGKHQLICYADHYEKGVTKVTASVGCLSVSASMALTGILSRLHPCSFIQQSSIDLEGKEMLDDLKKDDAWGVFNRAKIEETKLLQGISYGMNDEEKNRIREDARKYKELQDEARLALVEKTKPIFAGKDERVRALGVPEGKDYTIFISWRKSDILDVLKEDK